MTFSPAYESLKVIMHGDEVPGIIAYGFIASSRWTGPEFPQRSAPFWGLVNEFQLSGDGWAICEWDISVKYWPSGDVFGRAIRDVLGALISAGCRVAWIGAEGFPVCDPPYLFSPECMPGGVLAWLTDDGQVNCVLDLSLPLAPVSDAQLIQLQRYAALRA